LISTNGAEPQPEGPSILDMALQYANTGLNVFPLYAALENGGCSCRQSGCGNPGKHPITSNGFEDATTDEDQIRKWWTPERSKVLNIGIATGVNSGIVVLDVDNKNSGFTSLKDLEDKYGPLPETLKVTTGNGMHLYFAHPGEGIKIPNAQDLADYSGLDVRGDGGYVVAPPSLHSNGNRYAWNNPDTKVAPLPEWLLQLMTGGVSKGSVPKGAPQGTKAKSSSNAVERFLSHLKHVVPSASGWTALCPSHDDQENSLSVSEGDDRKVIIHCFAGCNAEEVVKALGLTMADLYEPLEKAPVGWGTPSKSAQQDNSEDGYTLAQYADWKKLSIEFLRDLGLSDHTYQGQPAVRIPYNDMEGSALTVQYRVAAEGNRFRWKSGSKTCLYGLSRLEEAKQEGSVVLVEGASDCHTLWHHGIPAVGLPSATGWEEERDAAHLDGIPTIFVVVEADKGGDTVKKWLAASSIRERVRLVTLGNQKDPSALHMADPDRFQERFKGALDESVSWQQYERIAKRVGETPPSAIGPRPALVSASSLLKTPVPEINFYWGDLLRQGGRLGLIGAPKVAKSFFALQLAVCVAEGIPFLGMETKRAPVLYVNFEISQEKLQERIQDICRELGGTSLEGLTFSSPNSMALDTDEGRNQLDELVAEVKPKVLILDPRRQGMVGDENQSEIVMAWCRNVDEVRRNHGLSLVVVHHTGKSPRGAGRGSNVFDAWLDTIMLLNPAEDRKVKGGAGLIANLKDVTLEIQGRDTDQRAVKAAFNYPTWGLTERQAAEEGTKVDECYGFILDQVTAGRERPVSELRVLAMREGHTNYAFKGALRRVLAQEDFREKQATGKPGNWKNLEHTPLP